MIAATLSDTLGIVLGVVLAAGLGAIAWFFRSWANGVKESVDKLGQKVDKLDEKVDGLSDTVAQMKVIVGWPVQAKKVRG